MSSKTEKCLEAANAMFAEVHRVLKANRRKSLTVFYDYSNFNYCHFHGYSFRLIVSTVYFMISSPQLRQMSSEELRVGDVHLVTCGTISS
ncbi:hypothetical protein T12_475 [Trichinella patagoniensis]|uniref:Uncharacterized protein n=1 Tax=Trichinella patagoniensis TaxID=990121 RepID=A0A0V0ZFU9_9BILA|nr:hypothetical protein T12_475 [Trichinella patagoniensis]